MAIKTTSFSDMPLQFRLDRTALAVVFRLAPGYESSKRAMFSASHAVRPRPIAVHVEKTQTIPIRELLYKYNASGSLGTDSLLGSRLFQRFARRSTCKSGNRR